MKSLNTLKRLLQVHLDPKTVHFILQYPSFILLTLNGIYSSSHHKNFPFFSVFLCPTSFSLPPFFFFFFICLFFIWTDTKKIVELDPSNSQARRAIPRLEQLAKEKQEKLKEEMIGKTK